MGNEISLSEYLASAQRGLMGRVFGPDFLKKQDYLEMGDIFTATYGRKVWDALNNRTVLWNALPKVTWGNTVGWRVRTARGTGNSRPITETGSIPTIDVSDFAEVYSNPRIVGTTFGVSILAQFTGTLEGGIGDALAVEQANKERDHIKEINQEMMAGTAYIISAATNAAGGPTFTVPATIGAHFKVGDTVDWYDVSEGAYDTEGTAKTVVSVVAGLVTLSTGAYGNAMVNGDIVFINARAGMTSLDDVCMELDAGVGGQKADSIAYSGLGTRTADTYAAAGLVDYNDGVARDLSLTLIDNCISKIRDNGGVPGLIVLGNDQYFKLERLMSSQQRYLGRENYVVGVGGENTFPGTQTGLDVATYMGIPIIIDPDCPKSVDTGDTVRGSNVYVLDPSVLEIAVAIPTQYIENRDFFHANAMVVRGLLYTIAEMRCRNVWVQAKISDLLA